MAETDDERESHHLIFSTEEPDLALPRATPDLRVLLNAGWRITKYEVVRLDKGYTVTVFLRRSHT